MQLYAIENNNIFSLLRNIESDNATVRYRKQ